ncbi:hypothetical protein DPEC_G00061080 [Dallia pectoralis]|uniref:Uncharacterized protein n=1 Tax=Dallia pectoralis TaxID=75939 RepID=A0ACC2H6U3_DALPE|nr:hypothetical protein DPEC_G00061080 [Dallia pectoralis]
MDVTTAISKSEKTGVSVDNFVEVQARKSSKNKTDKRYLPWRRTKKKSSKKVQANDIDLNKKNLEPSKPSSNLPKKLSNSTLEQGTSTLITCSNNATFTIHKAQVSNSNVAPEPPQTGIILDPNSPKTTLRMQTSELLGCLGNFLCRHCPLIEDLWFMNLVQWLEKVDCYLLEYGYHSKSFITPSNLVFLYMLCREAVSSELTTLDELQVVVLTCMYITCTYIGSETGYPLRPFLVETCKETFWERCLSIMNKRSGDMLRINTDPDFLYEVFTDLKKEGGFDWAIYVSYVSK